MAPQLPVLDHIDEIRSALCSTGAAVLIAPPGTGKTTGVPSELLDEPWLGTQRILVLEPRRVAARMAASRMAETHGERVGRTFGYSLRGESKRSVDTRVEVLTKGLFLRRIQMDPSLDGIGAVLLDEFHERSLDIDLALTLLLDVRSGLRPDLRLLIMSATLEAEPVAALLKGPIIRAEAPMFPVETRYRPSPAHEPLQDRVRDAVVEALSENPGDVLVFLPGRAEIRRSKHALEVAGLTPASTPEVGRSDNGRNDEVVLVELHGSLTLEQQQRAIAADPRGRRRVVLSTSLAETSITVGGVRIVVDAGRRRTVTVNAGNGLPALVTGPVSMAGADQRSGRAGRIGPGVTYRLWAEADNRHRPANDAPEILRSDLSSLLLQLRSWGVADPAKILWLDEPPVAALEQAHALLVALGAIDNNGSLTQRGRQLGEIGFNPRLAAVILDGATMQLGSLAAELAAVLETAGPGEVDIVERVRKLRTAHSNGSLPGDLRRALRQWRSAVSTLSSDPDLRRRMDNPAESAAHGTAPKRLPDHVAQLMLAAFPDRVARRRDSERVDRRGRSSHVFQLATGGELLLAEGHPLASARWIVVADLDMGTRVMHLGCELPDRLVRSELTNRFTTEESVDWNPRDRSIECLSWTRFGQIRFDPRPLRTPPPEKVQRALLAALAESGPNALGRIDEASQLRARVALLAANFMGQRWPDFSDEALSQQLPGWLTGRSATTTVSLLDRIDVHSVLLDQLDWNQRTELDRLAPTEWTLSSGRRVKLRYGEVDREPATVMASVRIRDALGTDMHPTVIDGRVAVVVELLSPAGRPVQRTIDLPGFWRGSYADVRSELRGRYPKHPWPEEPWKTLPKSR